jgi:hypothetical protein
MRYRPRCNTAGTIPGGVWKRADVSTARRRFSGCHPPSWVDSAFRPVHPTQRDFSPFDFAVPLPYSRRAHRESATSWVSGHALCAPHIADRSCFRQSADVAAEGVTPINSQAKGPIAPKAQAFASLESGSGHVRRALPAHRRGAHVTTAIACSNDRDLSRVRAPAARFMQSLRYRGQRGRHCAPAKAARRRPLFSFSMLPGLHHDRIE